jgi:hypothetical protein
LGHGTSLHCLRHGREGFNLKSASNSLAMSGWSISPSACRSASNRATTCRVRLQPIVAAHQHPQPALLSFRPDVADRVGHAQICQAPKDGVDCLRAAFTLPGRGSSSPVLWSVRCHSFPTGRRLEPGGWRLPPEPDELTSSASAKAYSAEEGCEEWLSSTTRWLP